MTPQWPSSGPPLLTVAFSAGTLRSLRSEVRAFAVQSGLPGGRTGDLILAVHELASNAVQHGTGYGWLRAWRTDTAVECQVEDGDVPAFAEKAADHAGAGAAGLRDAPDDALVNSLPFEPGHGLWVVRQVTDQLQTWSGPHGTSIRFVIDNPRLRAGSDRPRPGARCQRPRVRLKSRLRGRQAR